jgi:hypothetical protein
MIGSLSIIIGPKVSIPRSRGLGIAAELYFSPQQLII